MISNNVIEQVLDRADIVDVIGGFVQLKKKGRLYEACCPFHQENTPSFKVDPARNTWHCFGACATGGNVISFIIRHEGMSFPEAVKWLAKRYNIEVEEEELTPQQEAVRNKRESMLIVNEKVHEYYVNNINNDNPEAVQSKIYAEKRWGVDYVKEIGIGFASNGWTGLYDFAVKSGLSVNLMCDLGLLKEKKDKKSYYDFYRNRIIIPVRDRYHRVIAFTARDISEEDGIPKYMNSCDSEVYSKSNSIFGIDVAVREAANTGKFYCVEGAPDVMSLQNIGVNNAIASLGSSWTNQQFDSIKKYARKVCFLPDADVIKSGEKYGTGIKAVMKNGQLAMKCGFIVSVREIPLGQGNTKQDPGSYCTDKSKLDNLNEEDFINWYAKYSFADTETNDDKINIMNEVCTLIASLNDDVKEEMYLNSLSNYASKALWTSAMRRAKKIKHADEVINDSKKIDQKDYRKYGFYENHGTYCSMTDKGEEISWSNFTMFPLFHIKDPILPKRLYKIKNQYKQSEIVEMKQEDLVSIAKFKQKIEGLGNYVWLATDRELTKLKLFLYEKTETAIEIKQLGWQRQGFFAFGNGVYDTEWHPVDEYGIVRLKSGNYYLPAQSQIYRDDVKLFQFERRFVHLNYSDITFHDYTVKLVNVFGNNAKVGICFLMATLFRDIIVSYTKSFPILDLFGPKGSGKSELGHSLMSFFIIGNIPPNIMNSTIAAMADTVAQCANALVHIDEYKNTIDIDKREFLKGLWDGAGRSRMNMDLDKKREITSVDCGVILSGQEMPTIDIALFSRLIYLTFNKTEFSVDEKHTFNELRDIRKMGLSHLVLKLLDLRPMIESGFYKNYNASMNDLNDALINEHIEDRIQQNWVIPLATFRTLENNIDMPFTYNEMLKIVIDGIKNQNSECKTNNELGNFWKVVSYLSQDGEIYMDADYRIDYLPKIKTDKIKQEMIFNTPTPILRMQTNRIFMLYKKFGKQVGDNVLPPESLKYYLQNNAAYLGIMGSVRFKCIQKGQDVVVAKESNTGKQLKKVNVIRQAMCFDYNRLKEFFDVELDIQVDEDKEVKEELPF
jgi:DNA primase